MNHTFIPVSGEQFRSLPEKGPPNPSQPLHSSHPIRRDDSSSSARHRKRVPTWLALAELAVLAWFLLALAAIVLYAPFWLVGGLIKKRRRPAERAIRLWPLVAVLSLAASLAIFIQAADHAPARLGNLTLWSFGLFLCTLIFAAASLASAIALWLARTQPVRNAVRWFSIAVTAVLLIVTAYFAYWGIVGIRLWA